MVLAPYIIQKYGTHSKSRKFSRSVVINLGWIPKESKHLIVDASGVGAIEENDYSDVGEAKQISRDKNDGIDREAANSDYYWMPASTVTAYVRKGEKKDILRGYNNWPKQHVYHFIDLPFFSRIFGTAAHYEAEKVYFDRVTTE